MTVKEAGKEEKENVITHSTYTHTLNVFVSNCRHDDEKTRLN